MAYEGILFRTTDAMQWGTGKGSPLTAAEVDENFYTLATKVKDIQDNPPTPVEIANFQVVGSQLKIFMNDGTEFGPFTLPYAAFTFRDEWLPDGVQYYELDLVSVAGRGLFLVRLDHLSDTEFDPDAIDGDGNLLYLKVFGEDTYIYTFGFFYPSKPGAGLSSGDMIFAHLLNESVYVPADAAGSLARLRVPPDAGMTFGIYQNGDLIGSLDFTAGDDEGVVSFTGAFQFTAGDVVYVAFPDGGIDADAKDLTLTIKGFRGELPS